MPGSRPGRLFGIRDAALAERADHGFQYVGRLGDEGRVGALGELVEEPAGVGWPASWQARSAWTAICW